MRIFVYEHLTASGRARRGSSMYREGQAMREAVAADFARIRGVEVFSFPDDAGPFTSEQVVEESRRSDWALLIAPELDDCLGGLAEGVERAGGRLLGPRSDAIRMASDKLALFEHWRSHGIQTPATTERAHSPCEAFPLVWKPRDGAGSTMTFLLESARDAVRARAIVEREGHAGSMILQEYVPGLPASIAFVCGPQGSLPLPPARQFLSDDGRFTYIGGELPLPPGLAERAVRLGQNAVDCVPGLLGYVGVDLVLGSDADGGRDYAIEINPRVTTSYVGLRQLTDDNLAEAMLYAASGKPIGDVRWQDRPVSFAIE